MSNIAELKREQVESPCPYCDYESSECGVCQGSGKIVRCRWDLMSAKQRAKVLEAELAALQDAVVTYAQSDRHGRDWETLLAAAGFTNQPERN